MKCEFTHEHYRDCIKLAKKLGFSFYTFHDFLNKKPKSNFILMRHDVDISLKSALKIAEIENSLGVSSTYFIRTHGIFNIFSAENSRIIKELSEFGHEIGIHYDSDIITEKDFEEKILNIKKRMEAIMGGKIFGAAIHKVKKLDEEETDKLNFIEQFLEELDLEYDAYSNLFIKEMKYISDSAHRWREGCMCNHIKNRNNLHILTHPIWWSSTTTSLVTLIEELIQENK